MEGKYNVLDFSAKVIELAEKNRQSITNLQLQKVLYYIQGSFMKFFGMKAFDESIENWTYGPVVKSVWKEYNVYGRKPIQSPKASLDTTEEENRIILEVLQEKLSINPWKLVDDTHKELPWKNANIKGTLLISDDDMVEYFVN